MHLLPLAVPLAFLLRPTSHFHNHIIIPHPLTVNDLLAISIPLPPQQDQARRIASLALHSPTLARARRCVLRGRRGARQDFGVRCSWRRWADAEVNRIPGQRIRWLQRTRHPGDIVDAEGTDHRPYAASARWQRGRVWVWS
ncbi:hypothetical protein B0H16DRAFT_1588135 [Mycena metata]|uniref:Uncharacterized protein n=1 Tax=Mycena metata TaxID=1033252 RepID=A0AAD7MQV4_9AGAR|nr:hypothetical protein B0H16DRAFT_1588135 [Mycena metata]